MKETKLLENFRLLYLYDFNIKNTSILNDYPYISVIFVEGDNPYYYKNVVRIYTLMIGFFKEMVRIGSDRNRRPFYTKFIKTIKAPMKNNIDLSIRYLSNPQFSTKRFYSYSKNKFLLFDINDVVDCTFWEWIQDINYDKLAENILKLENEKYLLCPY